VNKSRPSITGTTHTLPFDRLSPRDFERLCLWLVERGGLERAEHLGAAGSEQGIVEQAQVGCEFIPAIDRGIHRFTLIVDRPARTRPPARMAAHCVQPRKLTWKWNQ
jgi:hypothetical protein